MQVNWEDLNGVDQPGEYRLPGNIVVTVKAEDIDIWQQHSDAIFELVPVDVVGPTKRYVLGMADFED